MRRRAARGVFGRIRVGTAGASPRLRRWALAAVLLGVALLPYPSLGSVSVDARGGVPVGLPGRVGAEHDQVDPAADRDRGR